MSNKIGGSFVLSSLFTKFISIVSFIRDALNSNFYIETG